MNRHESRAVAAWANPTEEHPINLFSTDYVSKQLKAAATKDCNGPGAKLLNKENISTQIQTLAKFRQHNELLNLPKKPNHEDLMTLVDTIYQMDLFDFPEYYDIEKKQKTSEDEAEYLCGILIGRFSEHCNVRVPEKISSENLYYHLDRLYNMEVVAQRERNRVRCQLPMYSRLPPQGHTVPPKLPNAREVSYTPTRWWSKSTQSETTATAKYLGPSLESPYKLQILRDG